MLHSSGYNYGTEIYGPESYVEEIHCNKKYIGWYRLKKNYFPDSVRFMYYNNFGKPKYMFSRDIPKPQSILGLIIRLFTPLLLLFCICFSMFQTYKPFKKLDPLPGFETVHICDNASVFNDKSKIESAMKSFEDATGICPYIVTMYTSEWKVKNGSSDCCPDSLYREKFTDEQHLLILYLKNDEVSTSASGNWSCKAAKGSLTAPVLSDNGLCIFNYELDKNLTTDSVTTDNAFIKTFNDAQKFVFSFRARSPYSYIELFLESIWIFPIIIYLTIIIRYYIYSHKEYFPAPYDEPYPEMVIW